MGTVSTRRECGPAARELLLRTCDRQFVTFFVLPCALGDLKFRESPRARLSAASCIRCVPSRPKPKTKATNGPAELKEGMYGGELIRLIFIELIK